MTDVIKNLITEYKSDIAENNFNRILLACKVKNMSELLDTFADAGITIPDGTYKRYAEVCCYLDTFFKYVRLENIRYNKEYTDFEFIAATRKIFDVLHTDNFRAMRAKLMHCHEEDRMYFITIRVDK